jgi:AcrR family transcriptional regulator
MNSMSSATQEIERSLALLWDEQPKTGRNGLSVQIIVSAAIKIATAKGLELVSMRSVADYLGAAPMSLYAHVPGKAELINLMIETAYAGLYTDLSEPASQSGGWRAGLTLVAARNWALFQTHPWLLDGGNSRPVLGPHTLSKYEAELRPLDNLGLSDVEMDSLLTLLLSHVEGVARAQNNLRRARAASGLSDSDWWRIVGPALERHVGRLDLRLSSRVGSAASEAYAGLFDAQHALQFGLERIYDSIALLIVQRKKRQPGSKRKH